MFDINNAINTAIAQAINAATQPLVEQIVALQQRCAALENNPAIGTDTALAARVTALEENKGITAAAFVTYLDSQEWFWDKLVNKTKEVADAAAEAAVDAHCSNYDHDDYDRVSIAVDDFDLDDVVRDNDLRDAIKESMEDASFHVSVRF